MLLYLFYFKTIGTKIQKMYANDISDQQILNPMSFFDFRSKYSRK